MLNLTQEELLSMTSHENLLTPEEEKKAIDYAIQKAKDHFIWRRVNEFSEPIEKVYLKVAEINWDEQVNVKGILEIANSNKQRVIWEEESLKQQKEQKLQHEKEMRELWTAQGFYSYLRYVSRETFNKELLCNDQTLPLIKTWCYFLSEDPRFETELGYKFGKGLLLRGISGLGKTFIAECLQNNPYKPIGIESMISISEEVCKEGEYTLKKRRILYLDDVGTEEPVINYFGTKIRWFKDFLEMYYLKTKDYRNIVISTNNNFDELEDKYGFRVRSRIKDIFNIVDLDGVDMRGM